MVSAAGRDSQRPRIGVTGAARLFSPSWWAIYVSVWLAGGRPIRISVKRRSPPEHLDAVIVSGGDDIHPTLYGEEAMPKAHYDPARDELEQEYIRFALDNHLPLMGICRGYQLINVTMGGSLFGDIRRMRSRTSNLGTILPRKTLLVEPESFIAELTRKHRLRINSLHHQAVDRVAEELVVGGRDLDGFVQVLEHHDTVPLLGVQWHPEYLFYLPSHLRLFRWLVKQARASC